MNRKGELTEVQKQAIVRRRMATGQGKFYDCPYCCGTGVDAMYGEDNIGTDNGDCEECGGTGQLVEQP